MKKIFTVIILLSASMWAMAQYFELNHRVRCDDADTMVNGLASMHKEQPIWYGTVNDTSKALLLANPETATWTIIITIDGNRACLLTSGTGFSIKAVPTAQQPK